MIIQIIIFISFCSLHSLYAMEYFCAPTIESVAQTLRKKIGDLPPIETIQKITNKLKRLEEISDTERFNYYFAVEQLSHKELIHLLNSKQIIKYQDLWRNTLSHCAKRMHEELTQKKEFDISKLFPERKIALWKAFCAHLESLITPNITLKSEKNLKNLFGSACLFSVHKKLKLGAFLSKESFLDNRKQSTVGIFDLESRKKIKEFTRVDAQTLKWHRTEPLLAVSANRCCIFDVKKNELINIESTFPHTLFHKPKWHPLLKAVVFNSWLAKKALVYDLEKNESKIYNETPLLVDPLHFHWNPVDKKVAYIKDGILFIYDFQTQKTQKLNEPAGIIKMKWNRLQPNLIAIAWQSMKNGISELSSFGIVDLHDPQKKIESQEFPHKIICNLTWHKYNKDKLFIRLFCEKIQMYDVQKKESHALSGIAKYGEEIDKIEFYPYNDNVIILQKSDPFKPVDKPYVKKYIEMWDIFNKNRLDNAQLYGKLLVRHDGGIHTTYAFENSLTSEWFFPSLDYLEKSADRDFKKESEFDKTKSCPLQLKPLLGFYY